jgi:membrane protein YqaA with SNARE-associated domain
MSTDPSATSPGHEQSLSLRSLLWQTILVTVVLVALVIVAGALIREPLTQAAELAVAKFGILGIAIGIFISDAFTFPIPPDTYVFLAVASNIPDPLAIATLSLASMLAGNVAYFLGPLLTKIEFLRKKIERFRERGQDLFLRYGIWTIALGALTPLPYSLICWLAGIYRMPYKRFLIATLFRIPRMVFYFYLFKLGWL